MEEVIRWAHRSWKEFGPISYVSDGEDMVLCLCPSIEAAMNILKKGNVRFKGGRVHILTIDKVSLRLETRGKEEGWVRLEGVALNLRPRVLFNKIGERFGGLVELKGEDKQWMERKVILKVKKAKGMEETIMVEGEGRQWLVKITEMKEHTTQVINPAFTVVGNDLNRKAGDPKEGRARPKTKGTAKSLGSSSMKTQTLAQVVHHNHHRSLVNGKGSKELVGNGYLPKQTWRRKGTQGQDMIALPQKSQKVVATSALLGTKKLHKGMSWLLKESM